jgi:hypothetical protein
VKLDETSTAVLTPAMSFGSSQPSNGNHCASPTTRMKK